MFVDSKHHDDVDGEHGDVGQADSGEGQRKVVNAVVACDQEVFLLVPGDQVDVVGHGGDLEEGEEDAGEVQSSPDGQAVAAASKWATHVTASQVVDGLFGINHSKKKNTFYTLLCINKVCFKVSLIQGL